MSLRFLNSVSKECREKLFAVGKIKDIKKGKDILLAGEKNAKLLFLVSGYASVYRDSRFAEKKIIFVVGPGELLNETALDFDTNINSLSALTDSKLLEIDLDSFFELASEKPELTQALFKSLSAKTRKLYHQLGNSNGTNPLENRLMVKIWKLGRDHGIDTENGVLIPFDVSVTFLANMLGAKRESVSREFSKLKNEQLILVHGKEIIVPDMDRLKKEMSL